MKEFHEKVLEFKRSLVEDLLSQCTEKQIELFNLMYGGIYKLKETSMANAYDQCYRTVKKNQAKDVPTCPKCTFYEPNPKPGNSFCDMYDGVPKQGFKECCEVYKVKPLNTKFNHDQIPNCYKIK